MSLHVREMQNQKHAFVIYLTYLPIPDDDLDIGLTIIGDCKRTYYSNLAFK